MFDYVYMLKIRCSCCSSICEVLKIFFYLPRSIVGPLEFGSATISWPLFLPACFTVVVETVVGGGNSLVKFPNAGSVIQINII
jgi:hypothetical protein